MNKLYVSLLLITLFSFSNAQESKRVLFIGNSYTGVNNLPQMVATLATSTGDEIIYDSNTPGGTSLQSHSSNATTLNKIMVGNWDFVVLQEQSQMPSFPDSYVQNNVYPFATSLSNTIKQYNSCAQTVFYTTWGRENGDSSNCGGNPAVCTYEGMDDLLQLRYRNMAMQNDGVLAPVAAVWRYIRANHANINLYSSDGSHPSLAGSYAAACAFYAVVLRKDPSLITDNYSLSPAEASIIRFAAKTIVYDNFPQWFVGKYDPIAQYTSTSDGNTIQFQNTSIFSATYLWDFGDGAHSISENPSHTYSAVGEYNVSLTSSKCGKSSTKSSTISVTQLNTEYFTGNKLTFYPNPVSDILTLNGNDLERIQIVDAYGKQIVAKSFIQNETTKLDFSSISSGLYIVKFVKDSEIHQIKILRR